LQANLLDTTGNLFFGRLRCGTVLSLLCSLDTPLGSGLLGLLPLLFCLFSRGFLRFLLLCLAGLYATKLFTPLLLSLRLDLTEKVTGCANLVAYR
jgi:hypothetical protein